MEGDFIGLEMAAWYAGVGTLVGLGEGALRAKCLMVYLLTGYMIRCGST